MGPLVPAPVIRHCRKMQDESLSLMHADSREPKRSRFNRHRHAKSVFKLCWWLNAEDLEKYGEAVAEEGYSFVDDLLEADAEELTYEEARG